MVIWSDIVWSRIVAAGLMAIVYYIAAAAFTLAVWAGVEIMGRRKRI